MNELQTIGQSNASFWYPALTDEEVAKPQTMAYNYRSTLARERRLYLIMGVVATAWLFEYIKYGPRKRRAR